MTRKAKYATVHRIRFGETRQKEDLNLGGRPAGALSWKVGSTGAVGADGYRMGAAVWCAIGLYAEEETARAALASCAEYMPYLAEAREAWHGLLLPTMHRGECNHLVREEPGLLYEVSTNDPGGKCMVVTTAGFRLGADFRVERVIAFRKNVDVANEFLGQAPGCLANQVFTPHTVGDDGCTMSIWESDETMLTAAYRAGEHRRLMDQHKQEAMMDRSSFTRFRILHSEGQWDGRNPVS